MKIVDCGAMPDATTKNVAHGCTYTGILGINGITWNTVGASVPLPYVANSISNMIDIYVQTTNITIITTNNLSSYTKSLVTLEYYR